jgi:stage V sporulation protein D (sporulation-specific penicillin-binding protein)
MINYSRISFLYASVLFVAIICVVRLFDLQIRRGEEFSRRGEAQQFGGKTTYADRFDIYFTTKDGDKVPAAVTQKGWKIFVSPKKLTEEQTQKIITFFSDKPQFESLIKLENLSQKKKDPYEELFRRISEEDKKIIENAKLEGIRFTKDEWRLYPGKSKAAQTLGFLSFDGQTTKADYGLEKFYDTLLEKPVTLNSKQVFALAFSGKQAQEIVGNKEFHGSLVTSIEPTVQERLDGNLAETIENYKPETAAALVMDSQNGEIVALSVANAFDPNKYGEVTNFADFKNPLIQSDYELGSIIKPIIMTLAFEMGGISDTTNYYDAGFIKVKDRTIYNFDKKGRGSTTMREVIKQSLNTGMVFAMQKMNYKKVRDRLTSLGIREKVNVDLPYEAKPLTSNLDQLRDVEYANISFGQGLAITPLSMVRAFSSIGTKGMMVTPHVGKAVITNQGIQTPLEYPKKQGLFNPVSAEKVTNILEELIDVSHKKNAPLLKDYSIAGKTGTAQMTAQNGGYARDKHIHSFLGYFPAKNPRFTVYYILVDPKGVRYASESLSKPFMKTIEFLATYYNIAPDRLTQVSESKENNKQTISY